MKKINCKGFTIIELVIYIALMSVLLLVVSRIFISALDIQVESQSASRVEQEGRFILSRLSYDIANSEQITTPLNLGDLSAELVLERSGTTYRYFATDMTLMLFDGESTELLNSNETKITDIQFQKIGNASGKPTLRINFTVTSSNSTGQPVEQQMYQTTVGMR